MEYYLVSGLYGYIIPGEYTCLIENGASKHMSGYKSTISNLKDKNFTCMVELGDNSTYSIQGIGSASFQLVREDIFHVKEIVYFLGLKKNLISVLVLEDKGLCVIFIHNQEQKYS